jgi:hypothetical protein
MSGVLKTRARCGPGYRYVNLWAVTDNLHWIAGRGKESLSTPQRPDWLWDPHSLSQYKRLRDGLPAGARELCLLHSVQTDSGTYPISYPTGIGDIFTSGKAAEA